MNAPAGFAPVPPPGPFAAHVFDTFVREAGGRATFGTRVLARHCNGRGSAHGGFLCTLADAWAARELASRLPAGATFATADLQLQFVGRAREGDWLEAAFDRLHVGRTSAVAGGALRHGERLVACFQVRFALDRDATAGRAAAASGAG